jgi:hypothetical protein
MGMTYYYYPVSNCGSSCNLIAGFSLTTNGGTTWTAGRRLSGNMELSWLPQTFSGYMVADYVATVFPAGGRAFPIFALALPPVGSLFQEAIYTSSFGYTQDEMNEPLMSSAGEKPISGIKSDHPMRERGEVDNLPPSRRSQQVPPRERD